MAQDQQRLLVNQIKKNKTLKKKQTLVTKKSCLQCLSTMIYQY